MRSVLVKFPYTDSVQEWGYSEVVSLRKWCYKNTKFPWCMYDLDSNIRGFQRFVIFEFNNNKEAMKFKLYAGA